MKVSPKDSSYIKLEDKKGEEHYLYLANEWSKYKRIDHSEKRNGIMQGIRNMSKDRVGDKTIIDVLNCLSPLDCTAGSHWQERFGDLKEALRSPKFKSTAKKILAGKYGKDLKSFIEAHLEDIPNKVNHYVKSYLLHLPKKILETIERIEVARDLLKGNLLDCAYTDERVKLKTNVDKFQSAAGGSIQLAKDCLKAVQGMFSPC